MTVMLFPVFVFVFAIFSWRNWAMYDTYNLSWCFASAGNSKPRAGREAGMETCE